MSKHLGIDGSKKRESVDLKQINPKESVVSGSSDQSKIHLIIESARNEYLNDQPIKSTKNKGMKILVKQETPRSIKKELTSPVLIK